MDWNPVAATNANRNASKKSSQLEIILEHFHFKTFMKYVSSTFYFGTF